MWVKNAATVYRRIEPRTVTTGLGFPRFWPTVTMRHVSISTLSGPSRFSIAAVGFALSGRWKVTF